MRSAAFSAHKSSSTRLLSISKASSSSIITMEMFGEAWVSAYILVFLAVANSRRSLLFNDGRFATGLFGIPASPVPSQRPEGNQNNLLGSSIADTLTRNLNFGTVLASCTIAMGRLSMPRKRFRRSCACSPTSKRPTKSISGSV
jgi:hypothetical protein